MDLNIALIALSLAAVVCAVAAIFFRYISPATRALFYLFKPLATCLILAVALIPTVNAGSSYGAAIAAGLVLSLAGDIWLELPGDRFVPGLASFLLTLICYGFAFATDRPLVGFPWPALPIATAGILVLWYLWPALPSRLRPAVSAYVLAMVAMASLAGWRALSSPSTGASSAAIGAILFLVSDALLAVDRFRRPFGSAHAWVLSTYYAGQLLISLSVGLLAGASA